MAGQYLLALGVQRVSVSTRRVYDGVLRMYITYPYHGNYKIIFENLTGVFLLFNISTAGVHSGTFTFARDEPSRRDKTESDNERASYRFNTKRKDPQSEQSPGIFIPGFSRFLEWRDALGYYSQRGCELINKFPDLYGTRNR